MAAIARSSSGLIWNEPKNWGLEKIVSDSMLASNPKYVKLWDSIQEILNSGNSWKIQCEALKDLAYDNLSGFPYNNQLCPHQHLLSAFFYLNNPDPSILAALLIKSGELAFQKAEEQPLSESKTTRKADSLWCEAMGVEPETMIRFTHGGGDRYIQTFLNQENHGYASEAGKEGIFVTPQYPNPNHLRDIPYATRTPIQHFDSPVVLNGEIPAKYLHKVNMNPHEAVIFSEAVPNIQNYRINKIDTSRLSRTWLEDALPVGRMGFGVTDYTKTLYRDLKDHYPSEILETIETYLQEVIDDARLIP